jgi:septum formation protein
LPSTLVLASASPQRRAILSQVGLRFDVRPADVEEDAVGDPAAVAEANARRKALAIDAELVLGADTVVAIDGDILGKPASAEQARDYLGRLAGRSHEVVGGFAIAERGTVVVAGAETTTVTFRAASPELLDWYVGTGEWEGRAGGYAIQGAGAALVTAVAGDYLNVVGLPLARILDLRPDLLAVHSAAARRPGT